jgi:Holliday junction resolvasome RuvABC endonuclease subunit
VITEPLRVLALDLSLDATGMAGIGTDRTPWTSTVHSHGKLGHARRQAILNGIASAMRRVRPHVVIVEDIFVGKFAGVAISLAKLHGIVEFYVDSLHVPYMNVTAPQIKQYATGKGSGPDAAKVQVTLAIERRYGALAQVADDNQADAFTMLAMVLHKYSQPFAGIDVPAINAKVLSSPKITWAPLRFGASQAPPPGVTLTPPGGAHPSVPTTLTRQGV